MLTINADDQPFMRNYYKPQDEKRMVAILPNGSYADWLKAPAGDSIELMHQFLAVAWHWPCSPGQNHTHSPT